MFFGFALARGGRTTPTLSAGEVQTVLGASAVSFLGAGAFGESWAFERGGETRVAKVLLNLGTTSREVVREVEGLTRVNSPHVVQLKDVFVLSLAIGGRPTLVFEFVDGGDVMDRILAGTWPSQDQVSEFAIGMLRGLVALHDREVVHRDIKFENIALRGGRWDSPVILDLGLGRLLDASTLNVYPATVGTPAFMAPEVISGRPARKGSDLWSLGIVLTIMLIRTHPFFPDPAEILDGVEAHDRLVAGAPPLPASVDEPLRSMVMRFLGSASYERGSARRALGELEGVAP